MSQLWQSAWFSAGAPNRTETEYRAPSGVPQGPLFRSVPTTFSWPVSGAWRTPEPGEHRSLANTRRGAKGCEGVRRGAKGWRRTGRRSVSSDRQHVLSGWENDAITLKRANGHAPRDTMLESGSTNAATLDVRPRHTTSHSDDSHACSTLSRVGPKLDVRTLTSALARSSCTPDAVWHVDCMNGQCIAQGVGN
jgi:hypothetical protein